MLVNDILVAGVTLSDALDDMPVNGVFGDDAPMGQSW